VFAERFVVLRDVGDALGNDLDDDAAAVGEVGFAADVGGPFEPVDQAGDGPGLNSTSLTGEALEQMFLPSGS
jgi:hypothetical protein